MAGSLRRTNAMSAADKVKAILNDPIRGKVLRQVVPEFVALVELMFEEEKQRVDRLVARHAAVVDAMKHVDSTTRESGSILKLIKKYWR